MDRRESFDAQSTQNVSSSWCTHKQKQMAEVEALVMESGLLPEKSIHEEVTWFYDSIGIEDQYFMFESVKVISRHVIALYGAKTVSFGKNNEELDINLEMKTEDGSVFFHTTRPGVHQEYGVQCESKIDREYLNGSYMQRAYRMESYRSRGTVSAEYPKQLRCYFVSRCEFKSEQDCDSFESSSDARFLQRTSMYTRELYRRIVGLVIERQQLVLECSPSDPNLQEHRLVLGYPHKSTQMFASSLADLYHFYGLFSTRKYVEQFSNGVTVMSTYLSPLPGFEGPTMEEVMVQIARESSLLFCLPATPLHGMFRSLVLSVQETDYAHCASVFAQHFLNRLGSEYAMLRAQLQSTNPAHSELLTRLKRRLRQETFTTEFIIGVIMQYPHLVRVLYVQFAVVHYEASGDVLRRTLSYKRLQSSVPQEDVGALIRATVGSSLELCVFEAFVTFNRHVLRTNFYAATKTAIAFRLDPGFLSAAEFPDRPHGIFLVIGAEFRGFHVRFRDVARGGVRVIRSSTRNIYANNLRTLFDENYALAATQQRKNKDIPEGGSKGTILLDLDMQDMRRVAFQKYIDALLDLLVTPCSDEMLFLGPDEGTADLMDWASQHALYRGLTHWRSFTTGKGRWLGGIPHDKYGMTTYGIHRFVLGIYRKLGLREEDVTKTQTGGPDGDLGSNEIKQSTDRTVSIVDGSGVLHDPRGINREQLLMLADKRQAISHFDMTKIGPGGFRVLLSDVNVRLPDGHIVDNGLRFRNDYHLTKYACADLFVPCGGRPDAVDAMNVGMLVDTEGRPHFRFVVEGANLFFTQEARLRLTEAGTIFFKDSSANKGGVTSSSMEVMAALALTKTEYQELMCQRGDCTMPDFYTQYVEVVKETIATNAEMEFECIWREHKIRDLPHCVISDQISAAIIRLRDQMVSSSLWNNVDLRRTILADAFPKLLVNHIGLDELLQRVPEKYQRALFASFLSSRFVYQHGTDAAQFSFFEFMSNYKPFSATPANR